LTGPTLRFHADAVIALTGSYMPATLNGIPAPYWQPLAIHAGAELNLGAAPGPGARAYIAIRGGIDVPEYLGSRSTFILGRFGGQAGRTLQTGDMLHWQSSEGLPAVPAFLAKELRPVFSSEWEIGGVYGPHGAPDFF